MSVEGLNEQSPTQPNASFLGRMGDAIIGAVNFAKENLTLRRGIVASTAAAVALAPNVALGQTETSSNNPPIDRATGMPLDNLNAHLCQIGATGKFEPGFTILHSHKLVYNAASHRLTARIGLNRMGFGNGKRLDYVCSDTGVDTKFQYREVVKTSHGNRTLKKVHSIKAPAVTDGNIHKIDKITKSLKVPKGASKAGIRGRIVSVPPPRSKQIGHVDHDNPDANFPVGSLHTVKSKSFTFWAKNS